MVIPTAQDRAPKNGEAPVHIGSGGAHSTASGPSANATNTLEGVGETGGRMAHANQQREEGMFPKQVKPGQSPSDGTTGGGEGVGRTHQA
ncbi:hypothetical protein JCM10908_003763 [Rhodotorula pacifica]|uniref:uncharacterized protein n=1 Tax=Rhodotorula pacifica TaxID=1495444 RepID=UPI0031821080